MATTATHNSSRASDESSEMLERFKLGFSNRTLCYRLPAKNRVEGAELRTRLQALGVLRDSGHEHFRGSVVIPILGESGEVLAQPGDPRLTPIGGMLRRTRLDQLKTRI